MYSKLEPKLLQVFREGYSRKLFAADLLAGTVVAIVALPLAIAFAIASGVKPEQGLYTAVIAGFFIALFGGSRVQVSGPTGAFIVIVYGIVQEFGYEGLALATLMAGVMLVGMGIIGMGVLLRFIPYPLTVGFTSGIAVIIFSSQIRDLLGLATGPLPGDFIKKWEIICSHVATINVEACLISAVALFIIALWPKVTKKVPGSLVAILVTTPLVYWAGLSVETIGSRFGTMPQMLPAPQLMSITWEQIQKLLTPAVTIAFLCAIESLLSATVADGMIGARHRSNMELVAQGVGNILSPLFGGIPATGAIARTAANVKNGGKTPIAAITHALVLLLIMYFLGDLARLIPLPTLAAILVFVAYNMSEWRTFVQMFRAPGSDVLVLVVTFLLTVFFDLTVAIKIGVILSAFLFVRRMEAVTEVGNITLQLHEKEQGEEEVEDPLAITTRQVPPGTEVFEIYGPLFFGAIERFQSAMKRVEQPPKVLILRMRHVSTIDASGLRALEDLLDKLSHQKCVLVLSGVRPEVRDVLARGGLLTKIGEINFAPSIDEALARARAISGPLPG